VLDYSGSMSGAIKELETSAKSFINNKLEGDKISLVRFDQNVINEIGLTEDKSQILNTVKFEGLTNFGGSTALYAAMGDGIKTITDDASTKNEMIIFTDGYENSSMFYLGEKTVSAQEVADYAIEKDVRINIISFGEGVNAKLLEVLSEYTGGNYYPVMSSKEINGVWAELPYLKKNFYTITFKTNDISKINGIKLKYFDNTGKTNFARRDLYINTPVDFYKYEGDEASYWMNSLQIAGNRQPISTPQVLALFSLNGRIVLNEYLPKVDTLVSLMTADTSICAILFGHTDQSDTGEYNDKLSEERCKFVQKYLISRGIDEKRIFTVAFGEAYPVWKEEKEEWQSQENRRVEVMLVK
jgi:outer membrane protein OmpA-like peptidoglycan-associated protein